MWATDEENGESGFLGNKDAVLTASTALRELALREQASGAHRSYGLVPREYMVPRLGGDVSVKGAFGLDLQHLSARRDGPGLGERRWNCAKRVCGQRPNPQRGNWNSMSLVSMEGLMREVVQDYRQTLDARRGPPKQCRLWRRPSCMTCSRMPSQLHAMRDGGPF